MQACVPNYSFLIIYNINLFLLGIVRPCISRWKCYMVFYVIVMKMIWRKLNWAEGLGPISPADSWRKLPKRRMWRVRGKGGHVSKMDVGLCKHHMDGIKVVKEYRWDLWYKRWGPPHGSWQFARICVVFVTLTLCGKNQELANSSHNVAKWAPNSYTPLFNLYLL